MPTVTVPRARAGASPWTPPSSPTRSATALMDGERSKKCVLTMSHPFIRYGEQCERENRWGAGQARSVDPAAFSSHQLGNGAELLWRVAGGEVEMVMTAVTNTWVGIGWRPQGADKSCHEFPSTIAKYSASDFSGMDCNDMVIGAAREGLGRVADYYTRDRSTPR